MIYDDVLSYIVMLKPAGADGVNCVVLGESGKLAHALDHTWAADCDHLFRFTIVMSEDLRPKFTSKNCNKLQS